MKIAQVAPLYESVPPKLYGGTERVVHYLTEELVKQGHTVTLFASGDSHTSAELISHVAEALRLNSHCVDPMAHHIVQLQDVLERIDEFDIVHFHTDYIHFPFTENLATPHLTTLHGRLDLEDLQYVYNKFPHQPVVSISNDQRKPLPQANFIDTVYHGLPRNLHRSGKGEGGYLAFLGRVSPEKGLPRAIEIAKAAGIKLKIAAKIDKADREYYKKEIDPLLDHPLIEFIGEINETQKCNFLGDSLAFLFPINWCEPFGMVMIEAMAYATPIIAHAMGSVPEIIQHGKNGFIVNTVEEAVAVIQNLSSFDRSMVRKSFEEKFTAERMAKDYVQVYEKLIRQKQSSGSVKMLNSSTIPIASGKRNSKIVLK
jgi:glycosyltransferase involved in cell wall biosynthesis